MLITYGYDAASRLNSLLYTKIPSVIGNITYTYDAAGRRTNTAGSLARTGLPQAIASSGYNAANRLTQLSGASLTYDANGNMTSDGTNTYTWDVRDQLASITGPGLTAAFQYDGSRRRRSKTINGATTAFLYDAANTVQELSGGSPNANMLTGLGVDEIFARTDSAGTGVFLTDASNSTVALLDGTGAMMTQLTYEPFGKTTTSGAVSGNSSQYTGRENDGTGLYYYRARYYYPAHQRFLAEDRVDIWSDENLYSYVHNDPVDYIDPSGNQPYLTRHDPGEFVQIGLGGGLPWLSLNGTVTVDKCGSIYLTISGQIGKGTLAGANISVGGVDNRTVTSQEELESILTGWGVGFSGGFGLGGGVNWSPSSNWARTWNFGLYSPQFTVLNVGYTKLVSRGHLCDATPTPVPKP